jgi:hypothetical protein
MNIHTCDICKTVIEHGSWDHPSGYTVGRGRLTKYEFCNTCGEPLRELLEKAASA